MKYRRLLPAIWSDKKLKSMAAVERLAVIYILTCEESNACGIFRINLSEMARALAFCSGIIVSANDQNKTLEIIKTVSGKMAWIFEEDTCLIYIPTWWKFNPPPNINAFKGFLVEVGKLEPSGVVLEFFRNGKFLEPRYCDALRHACPECVSFDTVCHTVCDTVFSEKITTVTDTVPDTETDTDTDTEIKNFVGSKAPDWSILPPSVAEAERRKKYLLTDPEFSDWFDTLWKAYPAREDSGRGHKGKSFASVAGHVAAGIRADEEKKAMAWAVKCQQKERQFVKTFQFAVRLDPPPWSGEQTSPPERNPYRFDPDAPPVDLDNPF